MSGWLLILALLVLGGVLSTLGDRLGTKVGKARLSLFNLRPRKTAVVITALTGALISAVSLALLLLMSERLRDEAIDLTVFIESLFIHPPLRVPGTAVFLSAEKGATPFALLHNLKHNKVLHAQNVFATVRHHEVPWIGFDRRVEVETLGHDCWQVVLHFGFKNDPDVPEALQLLAGRGIVLHDMETSYFLSRDSVVPTFARGMWLWREKLFASMHRNAAAAADFLYLPANRIVELGSKVEI